MGRHGYTPPQTAVHTGTDSDWAINREEKAQFDAIFNNVDKSKKGFITGEEAVPFFSNSRLPEDILAQIWDLADINSEGHLNRDEFAVAMHLIRQQRMNRNRPLFTTLPQNLVPPSMRQQIRPPAQPTAPAFGGATYDTSKSASDDLFGLDAFSAPAPTQAQISTGGSFSRPFDSDAFGNTNKQLTPSSPSGSQGSPQPSVFKPFVPSSLFGQTLTSTPAVASGSSGSGQSRGVDLLGDNDPEVSNRLNHETSELANLSNQIGQLSKQMGEVKTKRASTEHELSNVSMQKREFEMRLSTLRSLYEQEVKDVKNLEERLAASRSETRKLQQEIATTETNYQDLQNQHRQVVLALEADQRENESLKDRIRTVNAEMVRLRPQLEKLRSDARQQKGLVAINKKQLVTAETDRDKLRGEVEASKPAQQDSPWGVPPSHQVQSPGASSPATSNASRDTNPFFRKPASNVPENTMSPSPFSPGAAPQSNQGNFENVFGPPYPQSHTAVPPTSFRSESENRGVVEPTTSAPSGPSLRSSEGPDFSTPTSSPQASSYHESPRAADLPAPPESRQINSSFLPFRENNQRVDSYSSSMKVSAPPSRYGGNEFSGNETPTNWFSAATETPISDRDERARGLERTDPNKTETGFGSSSGLPERGTTSPAGTNGSRGSVSKANEPRTSFQGFGTSGATSSIPGAFPSDTASPIQPDQTGESTLSDRSKASSRPPDSFHSGTFPLSGDQRVPPATKEDFDNAFAQFGSAKQAQEGRHTSGSSADGSVGTGSVGVARFNREFPPIREHGDDDDSDSNSEHGFDDNFTSNSPAHTRQSSLAQNQAQQSSRPSTGANDGPGDVYTPRPGMSQIGSNSNLPGIGAQKSPGYEQTMGSGFGKPGSPRDSNQFPPEFSGLLTSRKDPTASQGSPEKQFNSPLSGGQTLFGTSTTSKGAPSTAFSSSPPLSNTPLSTAPSDAYQSAVSHPSQKGPSPPSQPPHPTTYDNEDFDKEFADLADAKETDDKADDEFGISSHHQEHLDEFNPTFDSPVGGSKSGSTSQKTTSGSAPHAEDSFNDFEHNIGHPTQASNQSKSMQPQSAMSNDWDAIFAGMEAGPSQPSIPPKENLGTVLGQNGLASTPAKSPVTRAMNENASSSSAPTKPPMPGRALTSGTEHDDPELKKLTGMGYPRDAALKALEKYNYNIDKVSILTHSSNYVHQSI
jgi:epidermal growth factor receptor substrate 15